MVLLLSPSPLEPAKRFIITSLWHGSIHCGELRVLGDDVDLAAIAGQFLGRVGRAEVVAPDEHRLAALDAAAACLRSRTRSFSIAQRSTSSNVQTMGRVDARDLGPGDPAAGGQDHRVERLQFFDARGWCDSRTSTPSLSIWSRSQSAYQRILFLPCTGQQ